MVELTLTQGLARAESLIVKGRTQEAQAIYIAILKALPGNDAAQKGLEKLSQIEKNVLFDGDDELFKGLVQKSSKYFEYGCGKSTVWTLENTKANVFSVDTSQEWIAKVKSKTIPYANRLKIDWVDCGAIGAWGRPVDYSKRKNFEKYAATLWKNGSPSLILIDGRFRVHVCLTAFKMASAGTKILFDDYINRPHYHLVEEFAQIEDKCGRMVLFVVSNNKKNVPESLIESFKYVMD